MEEAGRLTSRGNNRWDESRVYTIIMNEKYVGDVLMQKSYSENHITHKEVKNRDRVVPQRIGDAMGILCNETTMAEVGSLLIGDRIEQTA